MVVLDFIFIDLWTHLSLAQRERDHLSQTYILFERQVNEGSGQVINIFLGFECNIDMRKTVDVIRVEWCVTTPLLQTNMYKTATRQKHFGIFDIKKQIPSE